MRHRHLQPEVMDQPGLDPVAHHQALRALARLNIASRSVELILKALKPLIENATRPLRILDLATGGGDTPIALARWARDRGLPMTIDGCDISPVALDHAKAAAAAENLAIEFFPLDAVRDPLPTGYDVMLFSLFLHHLTDAECVAVLRQASRVTKHVIISDLHRSRLNLGIAYVASRLLTRSPVVHTDTLLSIRAAFTPDELRTIAQQAGLRDVVVNKAFPVRLLLTGQGQ